VKVAVCPVCSFPVPSDEVARQFFSGKRLELYEIVKASGTRGIQRTDIMAQPYAHDPAGGPESPNIVNVMVNTMNKQLAGFGLTIRANRPFWFYRLEAA
jgi:hypothetical protein